jgi:hypothetical protein
VDHAEAQGALPESAAVSETEAVGPWRPGLVLWLAPPVALGVALRLWGLAGQVLISDEIHSLPWALQPAWAPIFTFRPVDPCVPLTAYLHLVLAAGVPLTEVVCRLPALAAGLVALVLLPVLATRVAGRLGGLTVAWLVAISPSFVYYSRIARPYMIVVALGTLAAAAFWRWWRRGGRGAAATYAVAGAAATWFHPAAGAFVGAPLAFGALEIAYRRIHRVDSAHGGLEASGPGRRGLGALAAVAGLLALLVGAFLVPAWRSFRRVMDLKAHEGKVGFTELGQALRLQAGSASLAGAAVFWAVAAVGLYLLWRRRPELGLYSTMLFGFQWLTLGLGSAVVLSRYTLIALPVALLWVAEAVGALGRRPEGAARQLGRVVAGALVGGLVLTSPDLADPWLHLGPFAGSVQAMSFVEPGPRLPAEEVPPVYEVLARQPGHGAVIEVPATPAAFADQGVIAVSRLYRRPVILSYDLPWLSDPRLALRTICDRAPSALRSTGARFAVLVFHRPDLNRAARGLEPPSGAGGRRPGEPRITPDARRADQALRRAWGPPDLVDGRAELWDLSKPRIGGVPGGPT